MVSLGWRTVLGRPLRINMNHPAARRKWLALSACALLAGPQRHASAQSPPAGSGAAAQRVIEIRIVARKPEGGVRTIRATRGETIVLKIRSDENLSVHVHGYDLHQDVTPGSVASLTFVARWMGRFPVAAHLTGAGSGRHGPEPMLLYLEVRPE